MKNTAILTNYNIPEKLAVAADVAERFAGCGAKLLLPSYVGQFFGDGGYGDRLKKLNPELLPWNEFYQRAELVTVIGGDGSILEAARRCADREIPILGVNKGRLGYMAELEVSELDRIADIMSGNCRTEERAMLSIDVVSNGRNTYKCTALNDAVITNGSIARLIDMNLSEGGNFIGAYRADGMIISTPTGSTAYSLAAGGPILHPSLRGICVTPICPHAMGSRPIVFPDTAHIEITNTCKREPSVFLTVDGKINIKINHGDMILVTGSERLTRLIRVKPDRFYQKLCSKLENV